MPAVGSATIDRRTHWNIGVDPAGQIDSAMLCAGTGL